MDNKVIHKLDGTDEEALALIEKYMQDHNIKED